jgi:hypothetical protein
VPAGESCWGFLLQKREKLALAKTKEMEDLAER